MTEATTKFRPAKECNLWTMTDVEILGLQRGQWVYCCQPSDMDTSRPSRYFGTKKSGTIWAAHWQGSKQSYKQFQSWCENKEEML